MATEISISRLCSWLYSNGIRYHSPGNEKAFMVFENVVTLSKTNLVTEWSLILEKSSSWAQKMKLGDYWSTSEDCKKESALKWISGQGKRNDNGECFASKWDG